MIKNIFFLILSLLLASCSAYQSITIETSQPARLQVPYDIQSLTLMNRSMTPEFTNQRADSLQLYFYQNGFRVNETFTDSLASDTLLIALGDILFESGRFETVIPVERNIFRGLSYRLTPDPLLWNYVESICDLYETDALLVMENFNSHVTTDYKSQELGNSFPDFGTRVHYASIQVSFSAAFRLYDPAKREHSDLITVHDTLFWDHYAYTQVSLFNGLPSVKQALSAAGIQAAFELNDLLTPVWIKGQRGYFRLDKSTDTETGYIREGLWEEAYRFWLPFTERGSAKSRSMAEYNVALANEMMGNIDNAIYWATRSFRTTYRTQTEHYIRQLNARKQFLEKLEKQNHEN